MPGDPEAVFTVDVIADVFRSFLALFGPERPYSCMPTALIETAGHPPREWHFIGHAAEMLIAKWNAKKRKRHRNIEEEDEPPQPAKTKKEDPHPTAIPYS